MKLLPLNESGASCIIITIIINDAVSWQWLHSLQSAPPLMPYILATQHTPYYIIYVQLFLNQFLPKLPPDALSFYTFCWIQTLSCEHMESPSQRKHVLMPHI